MSEVSEVPDDRLHFVLPAEELEEGERVLIEIEGREIAVINVHGEYHAVANYCPHMSGPVAEGRLTGIYTVDDTGTRKYERENEIISGPWHGWEFDVRTGTHRGLSDKKLLTYDVMVRDGNVYVIM